MKRSCLVVAVRLMAISLCACTSYAERHAERAEAARIAKEQAVVELANRACASHGFQPGSEPFARCAQVEANSIRSSEALQSASQGPGPNILAPSKTTTECVKTVIGMECTTR